MKAIRPFKEFCEENIVKIQAPDTARVRSLLSESESAEEALHEIVKTIGITDKNANVIIRLCYDIIMERVRAEMLKKGYNAVGHGAHEAEVAYLRELSFPEKDVQFCDQLRYFRNGIMYYGKTFAKDYAELVVGFLERIRKRLS